MKWWEDDFSVEEGFVFASAFHNNTGLDFWGFIFKFLKFFYNKNDWREIKDGKYPKILESFIWSNIESIERFEVADRGDNCSIEDWKKIKKASLIFDDASHLIKALEPNIMIVLRWQEDDTWLTGGFSCPGVEIADHLYYYFVENTKTHIFWTAHPRWLRKKRIDEMVINILELIQQKQIFTSFPGEFFLAQKKERTQQISKLKKQLEEKAIAINLVAFDEDWGIGGESYFYFKVPNTKRKVSICFAFDSGHKDFTMGVYMNEQSNGYINLKSEISAKLTPVIGSDINYPNWAYLHYFDDDSKNWETNSKIWGNIDNGVTANTLIEKVKEIQKSLIGMDL